MAKPTYCWRCDAVVPMLDEEEWAIIQPLLDDLVAQIQRYRLVHRCGLAEALQKVPRRRVLSTYARLTGFLETDVNAVRHHRASTYGRPCDACGKPLRTPRARMCAACGAAASQPD
jgi:hypothetical protein